MDKLTYIKIIEKLIVYAEEDERIRTVLIVGSRARTVVPADQWSDLDLVIFAKDAQSFLTDKKWIVNIGKPYISFLENTAVGGGLERRIVFENGLDVDFAFFPPSSISELEKDSEVIKVFSRGVRVLVDKDRLTESLKEKAKEKIYNVPSISTEEINNMIQDFWYHSMLASKKLRRGELLDGKSICDSYMKNLLFSLIKIQTRLNKGAEYDTWHGYRFFEKWADPSIVQAFKGLYAHYEEEEIWTALQNTMQVFRNTAINVCEALHINYPFEADEYASKLVEIYYHDHKL
ncbi:aminoglycoside 6-adenylyltransferase [Heyndrickxia sporothermodurans]